MKALSLWQPHASLIFIPAPGWVGMVKPWETRGWPAPRWLIGDRLAIHAAKATDDISLIRGYFDYRRRVGQDPTLEPFIPALSAGGFTSLDQLPLGCLLGTVRVVACHDCNTWQPNGPSAEFGDFGEDRFAWELADAQLLPKPIPYRGRQGLFEVADEVLQ